MRCAPDSRPRREICTQIESYCNKEMTAAKLFVFITFTGVYQIGAVTHSTCRIRNERRDTESVVGLELIWI